MVSMAKNRVLNADNPEKTILWGVWEICAKLSDLQQIALLLAC
jgi:hypothetical protein